MRGKQIVTGKNESFRTEVIQIDITASESPYTASEKYNYIQANLAAGNIDIYLIPTKKPVHIARQTSGAEVLTIYPPVGTTGLIDGQSSITLDNQYDGVTLIPTDTNSFYAQYWKSSGISGSGSGEIIDAGNWTDSGQINLGNLI